MEIKKTHEQVSEEESLTFLYKLDALYLENTARGISRHLNELNSLLLQLVICIIDQA
jgi:hypothetical protein